MMEGIFLLHVCVSLLMTGIIWFVQIIHYPLFKKIPPEAFVAFEEQHTRLTGFLVAPLMLLELFTAMFLVLNPGTFNRGWMGVLLGALVLIWLSTFFIQMPLHRDLYKRYEGSKIVELVKTNWTRTGLWTLRSMVLLVLLWDNFMR